MSEDPNDDEIQRLKARLAELESPVTKASEVAHAQSGHQEPNLGRALAIGLLVIGAIVFLAWLFKPADKATPPGQDPGDGYTATQRRIQAEVAGTAPPAWVYSEVQDEMSGRGDPLACVTSTNSAYLTWPYSDTKADLCLRQSARHGLDVFVKLQDRGQIICRSYRDCTLKVRFDDGLAQSFSASEAADGSSDIVFIDNAARFIAAAKSAKTTRIELMFYRDGSQTMAFWTAGLDWPRPSSSATSSAQP